MFNSPCSLQTKLNLREPLQDRAAKLTSNQETAKGSLVKKFDLAFDDYASPVT